jgi:hypothetical protein
MVELLWNLTRGIVAGQYQRPPSSTSFAKAAVMDVCCVMKCSAWRRTRRGNLFEVDVDEEPARSPGRRRREADGKSQRIDFRNGAEFHRTQQIAVALWRRSNVATHLLERPVKVLRNGIERSCRRRRKTPLR